jgi:hypothetical protein
MEKLVQYYPKRDYWANLVSMVQKRPGFSSDRLGLDVHRLELALGLTDKASDYMEAGQLALQAGIIGEGKEIVDKGFQNGVLGQGTEGERHKRLRALAEKQMGDDKPALAQAEQDAASKPDGVALFKVGESYAAYGQADKGIALMQSALQKGGFKNPDEQKLHLGYWQLKAGKKAPALETLKQVKAADGSGDLAHLWTLYASTGPVAAGAAKPAAQQAPAAAAPAKGKKT